MRLYAAVLEMMTFCSFNVGPDLTRPYPEDTAIGFEPSNSKTSMCLLASRRDSFSLIFLVAQYHQNYNMTESSEPTTSHWHLDTGALRYVYEIYLHKLY